ncbi:MAG: ribosome biogenesis GTP-binding protein YihA/YsxC [Desulfofustis sp.]|nr:ribosome biogenesis GTP-binding protein YihA/YsxC [Desulfofustis sp.]
MNFGEIQFLLSVHSLRQLPQSDLPEIAFAGRSNVGKSSLLNALFDRKNFVKVSSRPGKTQGLNYFHLPGVCNFVDLPGYGYAKVSKQTQEHWGKLITNYLESRKQLRCVVVIMDLRHEAKRRDRDLLMWLRQKQIRTLAVYTKADKLSGNSRSKQARQLDSGHGISADDRIVFSSVNRQGRDALIERLQTILIEA